MDWHFYYQDQRIIDGPCAPLAGKSPTKEPNVYRDSRCGLLRGLTSWKFLDGVVSGMRLLNQVSSRVEEGDEKKKGMGKRKRCGEESED